MDNLDKAHFRETLAFVLSDADISSSGLMAFINAAVEKARQSGQRLDHDEQAKLLGIYRQGYKDALAAIAKEFGVTPGRWSISPDGNWPDTSVDLHLLTW